jgi:hypothetical protein
MEEVKLELELELDLQGAEARDQEWIQLRREEESDVRAQAE